MKAQTRPVAVVNYNELCNSPGPDVALMPQILRNLQAFVEKAEEFFFCHSAFSLHYLVSSSLPVNSELR